MTKQKLTRYDKQLEIIIYGFEGFARGEAYEYLCDFYLSAHKDGRIGIIKKGKNYYIGESTPKHDYEIFKVKRRGSMRSLDGLIRRATCTNKQKPLHIEQIHKNFEFRKMCSMANRYLTNPSKHVFYINDDFTHIYIGKDERIIDDLFSKVENGIEIFPAPELQTGYREQIKPRMLTAEAEIVFRIWSQEILSSMNPDRVEQGKLIGSGGSYKAFYFGDKVLAEFDQEYRATYVLDKDYFDVLRVKSRLEIIREKPKGFIKRIVHTLDRKKWIKQIKEVIENKKEEEKRLNSRFSPFCSSDFTH